MEKGEPALIASVDGAREIGFAVIATTCVLVAVFLPMSFLQGNVGKLFREFGFTIAAAVLFSALVALTLTPMMASKLFKSGAQRSQACRAIEHFFGRLAAAYDRGLRRVMLRPWLVIGGTLAASALAAVLLRVLPQRTGAARGPRLSADRLERARGRVARIHGSPRAHGRGDRAGKKSRRARRSASTCGHPGGFGGAPDMSQARGFMLLAPWDERDRVGRADRAIHAQPAQPDSRRARVRHRAERMGRAGAARAGRARRHRVRRSRAMARPAHGAHAANIPASPTSSRITRSASRNCGLPSIVIARPTSAFRCRPFHARSRRCSVRAS